MQVTVYKMPESGTVWVVEAIDFEADGIIYMVEFSGPFPEQRAKDYARQEYGDYTLGAFI